LDTRRFLFRLPESLPEMRLINTKRPLMVGFGWIGSADRARFGLFHQQLTGRIDGNSARRCNWREIRFVQQMRLPLPLLDIARNRFRPLVKYIEYPSPDSQPEPVEHQVKHRCCVERQQLTHDEAAE